MVHDVDWHRQHLGPSVLADLPGLEELALGPRAYRQAGALFGDPDRLLLAQAEEAPVSMTTFPSSFPMGLLSSYREVVGVKG
ncbi:hypothetical protein SAZ11_48565 [Streptomyces sp. FXJ1.4098]|nr:hypothetical protein [Streptomyces sp. FXJ1.4098]